MRRTFVPLLLALVTGVSVAGAQAKPPQRPAAPPPKTEQPKAMADSTNKHASAKADSTKSTHRKAKHTKRAKPATPPSN